jgi:hypothetical protein
LNCKPWLTKTNFLAVVYTAECGVGDEAPSLTLSDTDGIIVLGRTLRRKKGAEDEEKEVKTRQKGGCRGTAGTGIENEYRRAELGVRGEKEN